MKASPGEALNHQKESCEHVTASLEATWAELRLHLAEHHLHMEHRRAGIGRICRWWYFVCDILASRPPLFARGLEALGSGCCGHPKGLKTPLESIAFPLSASGIVFCFLQGAQSVFLI